MTAHVRSRLRADLRAWVLTWVRGGARVGATAKNMLHVTGGGGGGSVSRGPSARAAHELLNLVEIVVLIEVARDLVLPAAGVGLAPAAHVGHHVTRVCLVVPLLHRGVVDLEVGIRLHEARGTQHQITSLRRSLELLLKLRVDGLLELGNPLIVLKQLMLRLHIGLEIIYLLLLALLRLLLLIDLFLVVADLLLQSLVLERQLGVLLLELRELLLALSSDLLLVSEVCELRDFVLKFHHAPRLVLVLLEEDTVL